MLGDQDLNIKLGLFGYNGMRRELYDWLCTVVKIFAYKDLANHKKGQTSGSQASWSG